MSWRRCARPISYYLSMLSEEDILDQFRRNGVIGDASEGHFITSDGFHAATLIRVEKALQFPPFNRSLSYLIARHFLELDIHVVAAASTGAIPAAVEVGRQLEARTIFTAPHDATALYGGFMMHAGERVVILQDLLCDDAELENLTRLIRAADARLIGVGSIVDARRERKKLTFRDVSAIRLPWERFPADACPLCNAGSPLLSR